MTDHSQSTSDTMNEESDTQHGIRWGIIFLDLCILLLFSGILMGIAIGIQKAFSVTNDAQALISTIQKGQLIDGKDPVFLQALGQNHNGEAAKLANTPDFSGRTPTITTRNLPTPRTRSGIITRPNFSPFPALMPKPATMTDGPLCTGHPGADCPP